jgi:hypothetical protein
MLFVRSESEKSVSPPTARFVRIAAILPSAEFDVVTLKSIRASVLLFALALVRVSWVAPNPAEVFTIWSGETGLGVPMPTYPAK